MIRAEQFIKVWQTASTLAEAAKKLGLDDVRCASKAARYRKRGIPLKSFPSLCPALNIAALTELANSLLAKATKKTK